MPPESGSSRRSGACRPGPSAQWQTGRCSGLCADLPDRIPPQDLWRSSAARSRPPQRKPAPARWRHGQRPNRHSASGTPQPLPSAPALLRRRRCCLPDGCSVRCGLPLGRGQSALRKGSGPEHGQKPGDQILFHFLLHSFHYALRQNVCANLRILYSNIRTVVFSTVYFPKKMEGNSVYFQEDERDCKNRRRCVMIGSTQESGVDT